MGFDAKSKISKIKGKDYLEVKWRIVWFRDENPHGTIETSITVLAPDVAVATAAVSVDGHLLATGTATVRSGANQVWSGRDVEKAETAAIGRALAHAGYGTQFTDEDEGDYLADAPVSRMPPSDTPKAPRRVPATNGKQTKADAPDWTTFGFNFNNVFMNAEVVTTYPELPHRRNTMDKLARDGFIVPEQTDDEVVRVLLDRPDKA